MEIITDLRQLHKCDVPCVVALGTFDGLHRGHLDVIGTAKKYAVKNKAPLAVFTFSNHPFACFRPDKVPSALITSAQKQALLAKLGVDILVDVPFDISIARLEPEVFLQKLQKLNYNCLVVGSNFTYGIRGEGSVKSLQQSAEKFGFQLVVRQLVEVQNTVISSTVIRQLIAEGKVEAATQMLGRYYAISGVVAEGNKRGRLLGYPTANIELYNSEQTIPSDGVYAVLVHLDNKIYQGMANVGKNPTFGDVTKVRLETHIFDFAQNIYGKNISIDFVKRVRGEVKFTNLEELQHALLKDKNACQNYLKSC